jgi:hypothetical protein
MFNSWLFSIDEIFFTSVLSRLFLSCFEKLAALISRRLSVKVAITIVSPIFCPVLGRNLSLSSHQTPTIGRSSLPLGRMPLHQF